MQCKQQLLGAGKYRIFRSISAISHGSLIKKKNNPKAILTTFSKTETKNHILCGLKSHFVGLKTEDLL